MKVLIDMNLSPLWVPFLEKNGIEAAHWSTISKPSAPDSQILDYAAANGFVVFTHDLDFGILLAARKSKGPSVIQVRTQDVLPAAIGPAGRPGVQHDSGPSASGSDPDCRSGAQPASPLTNLMER